jgi:hypothetical protein
MTFVTTKWQPDWNHHKNKQRAIGFFTRLIALFVWAHSSACPEWLAPLHCFISMKALFPQFMLPFLRFIVFGVVATH